MCTYISTHTFTAPIIDSGVSNREWNSIYSQAVHHCLWPVIVTNYIIIYDSRYLYIATVYRIADKLYGVCMLTSNKLYR